MEATDPPTPDSSTLDQSEPRLPGSHKEQATAKAARWRWTWLVAGGILLLVTVVAFAGAKSYQDLAAAKKRAGELEAQIRATELRVKELDQRIDLLLDDPDLLDYLARENLGLVAADEVVVMLPEDTLSED